MLSLVLAQVEYFKGAVVFTFGFELPLDADQPLAGCMNSELTQVSNNPLATQPFGHGGGGAGTAKRIGDQVAFVG